MRWTADTVSYAVAKGLFPWRRYIVVPNVSWGLLPHEADLVALSAAGWLTEVEVKVSKADFLADREKYKHQRAKINGSPELICEFYYAMPTTVWEKCKPEDLPEGAGLILCSREEWESDPKARVVQKPMSNPSARKLTDNEREQLLRLGYLRYWGRQEAVERVMSMVLRQAEAIVSAEEKVA